MVWRVFYHTVHMAREVSGRDDMRFALCGEDDTIHFLRKYIMSEAFIYLWYDAPNKKYYLGKHKGSPDDSYTHSSTMWEHFTKNNIPEGVSRRILAYGTDEEMCVLEHELLVNRKKRCWNRYYNKSLGDPRYVDTSGENHPMWKGGISLDKTAYRKVYQQTPEFKAHKKVYWQENKERLSLTMEEYRQRPEYKEQRKKYNKKYLTPERKAYFKEWNKKYKQTPEYKARHKKYMREWRARKKAERQGAGTLDAFLK